VRQSTILLLVTLCAVLVFATTTLGQGRGQGRGSQGWGIKAEYQRLFDPTTLTTIQGEVLAIENFIPRKGMGQGMHLKLKTGQDTISVHLGPAWFLENQDIVIAMKDVITVTGSKIVFDGASAIIASEVTKGDQVLVLHDKNGIPAWAGWRNK